MESIIEYNCLITLLQQSSGDQIEVKAELVERASREYLQTGEWPFKNSWMHFGIKAIENDISG